LGLRRKFTLGLRLLSSSLSPGLTRIGIIGGYGITEVQKDGEYSRNWRSF